MIATYLKHECDSGPQMGKRLRHAGIIAAHTMIQDDPQYGLKIFGHYRAMRGPNCAINFFDPNLTWKYSRAIKSGTIYFLVLNLCARIWPKRNPKMIGPVQVMFWPSYEFY